MNKFMANAFLEAYARGDKKDLRKFERAGVPVKLPKIKKHRDTKTYRNLRKAFDDEVMQAARMCAARMIEKGGL